MGVSSTWNRSWKERVERSGTAVALESPSVQLTFSELDQRVEHWAFGLMGLGLGREDKVLFISDLCPELILAQLSVWVAGAYSAVLPVHQRADERLQAIFSTLPSWIVVQSAKQWNELQVLRAEHPQAFASVHRVWMLQGSAAELSTSAFAPESVQTVESASEGERNRAPARVEANRVAERPEDPLQIGFSTGVASEPRWVLISHAQRMRSISDLQEALDNAGVIGKNPRAQVLIPAFHFMAQQAWMWALLNGVTLVFGAVSAASPSLLFALPMQLDQLRAEAEGGAGRLASALYRVQELTHRLTEKPTWIAKVPQLGHQVGGELLRRRAREVLGNRLRWVITGGDHLSIETAMFFQHSRMGVLEGYGLTETAGWVCLNLPGRQSLGTAGRPLGEVSIRSSDSGELWVKPSPHEEWIATGDLGFVDQEGFIHLQERAGDLVNLPGGGWVEPSRIQAQAKDYRLLKDLYIDSGSHGLIALITLQQEEVVRLATQMEILFSDFSELIHHPRILDRVQAVVDELNRRLEPSERIRRFTVLPYPFDLTAGELTPLNQQRREVLARRYQTEIDRMRA